MKEEILNNDSIHSPNTLVSVIVRTCNRPSVLKQALTSLRNQTYPYIEVVVVEDGLNISQSLVEEFSDLTINYYATKEKVGRSKVGNIGMTLAKGKYLNFLDDDDLLYPNHIEVLVSKLIEMKTRAAYSIAEEAQIIVKNKNPYEYEGKSRSVVYNQTYNKMELFYHNYLPIQSVMFEKSLFTQLGGFDERLDALEDWDLWVRYSTVTDFIYVPLVTSVYYVPYDKKEYSKRHEVLHNTLQTVRNKHKEYHFTMDVFQASKEIEQILETYNVPLRKKIARVLKKKHPHVFKVAKWVVNLLRKLLK